MSNRLADAVGDRYTLGRELGAGGMATVYLARDLKHDRDVAIKVLRDELAASVGAERFLAEIKTTARLTHPHILPLHDSGEADGFLYYVMPFVDGETLRDRIERDQQLPLDEALSIARAVADALAYAHSHGIVHRDIKPENIFLAGGHALVADFGIARALATRDDDARMTVAGLALGTPAYMSPEQAAGDPDVDGRADQYALASVLYEMLTGEAPFVGPTVESILVKRFTQPPPRVTARRPNVPRAIEAAICTAMARQPDERFESVARFAASLSGASVRTAAPRHERSIAVLPFANMSGDPENEYFSDGISEEIINALTQLDGLHVAARTSAFSYKGKNADLRTIGDQLGVATVLEGSVRKAGNRIRITAQLIDVADGYHLWSERYDRDLVDVFAIQDEIANAIAAKLNITLGSRSDSQLVKPPTDDVDAYDAYLKGRAFAALRGAALSAAPQWFERAVALDPGFAAAYANLGQALLLASAWGLEPWSAVRDRAANAVARALELDANLVSAHVARGLLAFFTYDREGASAAWLHALTLDPSDTDARMFHVHYDLAYQRGQTEVAAHELEAIVALDPRSAMMRSHLSIVHSWGQRYDQAAAEARRAVELAPDAFYPSWALMLSAVNSSEGFSIGRALVEKFGRHPWAMMGLSFACINVADTATADALYAELEARARTGYVQPLTRAMCAMAADRRDDFYRLLNEAVDVNDPMLAFVMSASPLLDRHRGDPAFRSVLTRMGWSSPLPPLASPLGQRVLPSRSTGPVPVRRT